MNIKRVAYETKPYSAPPTNVAWRPDIRHDWQNRQAPYMKALSSDVSRRGSVTTTAQPRSAEPATPKANGDYGSSGMSESEVDRVVEEFLKSRG